MPARQAASAVLCLLQVQLAVAAPQTFNSALPVAKGNFVLREQFFLLEASGGQGLPVRDFQATGLLSVVGYGVNHELALFAVVPWQRKELDTATASRDGSGLGDVSWFARYTAWQRDRPGQTMRLAPFAGVQAPTGTTNERDRFGRLPRAAQPGTGVWGGFGGLVYTWQTLAWELDAQLRYQANSEDGGFGPGDTFNFDASWQQRIWPRELGEGVPGFLYAVLESNLIRQDRHRLGAGRRVPDSGGTKWFLSPGLQWVTRRWVVEAIVQLPVEQDLNGRQPDDDFIVRAGLRFQF